MFMDGTRTFPWYLQRFYFSSLDNASFPRHVFHLSLPRGSASAKLFRSKLWGLLGDLDFKRLVFFASFRSINTHNSKQAHRSKSTNATGIQVRERDPRATPTAANEAISRISKTRYAAKYFPDREAMLRILPTSVIVL